MKDILINFLTGNLLPLAFLGDSVHTLFIRQYCLTNPNYKIEAYHSKAAFFCKASSQAKSLHYLMDHLNDDEKEIVRRGRNLKPKHHAKNASSADYNYATAFEVLIGYLYLSQDNERLKQILNLSIKAHGEN